MPFKSKAQQKACYATKGFNGKVDCKAWSDITDQKSLPKKAKKKYQFAGAANPCGEGTQWDDKTMQCIPIPKNPNRLDRVFQQNYVGDPSGFTDKNARPINADGTYNTAVYSTDKNSYGYNSTFQGINLGLDFLQGFGNIFADVNTKKKERLNLQKARYSHAEFNPYEEGLNQGGVYEKGGSTIEINPKHKGLFTKEAKAAGMSVAEFAKHVLANKDKYSSAVVKRANFAHNFAHQNGGNAHQLDCPNGDCTGNGIHLQLPKFLQADPNKSALRQARRNFNPTQELLDDLHYPGIGLRAHTFDPQPFAEVPQYPSLSQPYGVSYQPNNTAQNGGLINNTGYTPGTNTFNNPLNIIPSGNITMENTPFPVMGYPDKGQPILMHPGQKYNFKGANHVLEIPHTGFKPDSTLDNLQYNFKNGNAITAGYDGGINIGAKINFKTGGDPYAGQTDAEFAARILNSGKKLTKKQKQHFKFVSEGRIPMDGHIKDAKAKGTYQQGGDVPEVKGVGSNEGNAELEQGEVFQQQQGNIQKVAENEPTHENGGSVQPNVSRVLEDTSDKRKDADSKALRVTPAMAKTIVGFKPKGTVTHSKLYEQASKKYDTKLKGFEKKLETNLEYVKQNGGVYAKNSLEQNLNLLQNMLTKGDIFDTIYAHQEQVKQMNGIDNNPNNKYGGKPKYAIGGYDPMDDLPVDPYKGGKTKKGRVTPTGVDNAFTFNGGLPAYQQAWQQVGLDLSSYNTNADAQGAVYDYLLKNHPDTIKQMWKQYGNTAAGIKQGLPTTFNDDYLNDSNNLQKLKTAYTDNLFGVRTLTPNIQTTQQPDQSQPPVDQPAQPFVGQNYPTPNGVKASQFNQPLQWYDVAGNIDNYLSSSSRTPVSFEQLDRQPLRAHLLNPQPALDANTGDFKAALATLPNNGVGFANQANLLANKYKVNNETVGQYANQNNQIQDRVDEINNNNKYQLDTTNLGLRDRAVEQQLQGQEVERQSKLNAFDDYLTKIAQNAQLNRNGNLVLQLTPFFDQYGKFNGNKYIFQDKGDGSANVLDKKTGKLIKTITTDGYGMPKQTKTYIRS